MNADRLYLHHESIAIDEAYGFDIKGVRCVDQSANSNLLNPVGDPCDVLYDTKNGGRLANKQIACIPVVELRQIAFPNPNMIKKNAEGQDITPAEAMHNFDVQHSPTPCMYPHCEILLYQNGERRSHINSNAVKSTIRRMFARIADQYRSEVLDRMRLNGLLEQ
ncbi:MAG: hypothetical protein WCJ75_17505 [Desulfomonile sp.]